MVAAFRMLRRSEFVGQAIRFGVVGVANTAVGLGIIYACLFWLGWSDPAANITGYAIGLIQSFALNRAWTFRSRVKMAPAFLRFVVVFGVSYGVNLALVLALRHAGVGPALAHAAGMPIYTLLFFLLSRALVFRPTAQSATRTPILAEPKSAGPKRVVPSARGRVLARAPDPDARPGPFMSPFTSLNRLLAVTEPLLLAILLTYGLFTIHAVLRTPGWGWDIHATCPCLTALLEHQNPYSSDDLQRLHQTHLSCAYQPATYHMLLIPCRLMAYGKLVGTGFFVVAGTFLLYPFITSMTSALLFATILLGAFSGLPFYLLTGNVGASLEFFLLCLFITLFHQRRYLTATATLSAFGFVEIVPILTMIPYLWFLKAILTINLRGHLVMAVAVLSALFGVGALSGWEVVVAHFRPVLGGVPSHLAPIDESYFGWSNPTLLFLIRGAVESTPVIAMLYLSMVAAAVWAIWRVARATDLADTHKMMFLLLTFFLILPRIKPYFFLSCATVLFVLFGGVDGRLQRAVLMGFALLYPLVSFNLLLDNGLTTPINDAFGGASVFSLGLTVAAVCFFLPGHSERPVPALGHVRKAPR